MKRMIVAAAMVASAAHAADKPVVGPPPSWVRPLPPTPAPAKNSEGAAAAILAQDAQYRLDPEGQSEYEAYQVKAQSAAGLAALGTVALTWSPATDTLTVHRVRILRGATSIDLLPKDGAFTVMRRELQLESEAMLTGALTAVVQPEGLQVGDVLDVAYTLRRVDPLLRGRADLLSTMAPAVPIAYARTVASWPSTTPAKWRTADGMPEPVVSRDGDLTVATIEARDLQPQPKPEGAPPRFRIGRQLMVSSYGSWADVSALMAPLYAEASRLPPGSPVEAEVRAIAAASSDPAARASAALALVQEKVRYLALVQGELGLKPAAADVTWSRRYGDCKGKTVLLLALLKALGIEAEPVLASSALGDGLDQRLPAVSVFDHVLVRARVEGRDYWLDGTRLGDRDLASISTPSFGFVLPVRPAGATLVHLTPEPAKTPLSRTAIRIDASKGIDKPAPFHVEATFRGDEATTLNLSLANLAPDDLDRALKSYWRGQYDFVAPSKVSASFDPKVGEERLVMDGEAKMDWSNGGYEADGAVVGWRFDPHRDPGPHADAPFAVGFPSYSESEETILLPNGGKGFTVWGENVDRELAGYAFHRRAVVTDGDFRLETTSRALRPEITLAQAQRDAPALTELGKGTLRLRSPPDAAQAVSDRKALVDSSPTTRDGYIAKGTAMLDAYRFGEALKAYDKAVDLDPGSAAAIASRGLAHVWLYQTEAAQADLNRAEMLDPAQAVVWRARGLLAQRTGKLQAAVDDFSRAIAIDPTDAFSRIHRGDVYLSLGDEEAALKDADAMVGVIPGDEGVHNLKALIYGRRKDFDAVRREAALGAAAHAEAQRSQTIMETLWRAGDKEGLRKAADAALAVKPDSHTYMLRADSRNLNDRAGMYADVKAAAALDPKAYDPVAALARLRLDDGDQVEALAYAQRAAAIKPDSLGAVLVVAEIQGRAGDKAEATAGFAKVRAEAAGNANLLNSLCYAQATAGFALDQALNDCDASLKLRPGVGAVLDSRAFVLLRLNRDKEALATYDSALAASPGLADSLYGRSLVERRLGDTAAADRDLKAAIAAKPNVQKTFAGYGVTR